MLAACFRVGLPDGTDWNAIRNLLQERARQLHRLPGRRVTAFVVEVEHRAIGGDSVWETRDPRAADLRSNRHLDVGRKLGEPKACASTRLRRAAVTHP